MQKFKKPEEMHQVWTPERAARRRKEVTTQIAVTSATTIVILLAFIPIILMLFLSLKSKAQFFGDFWAWPNPPKWSNYAAAWSDLAINMLNSVITVLVGTFLTVCLSAMSGYVFAKLEFPLKNFLFLMLLALMMIPGVLTLTPSYFINIFLWCYSGLFCVFFNFLSVFIRTGHKINIIPL